MIIDGLSVTDFRVFKGKHEFDLTPRKRWGANRPIILFGGLNGAGKPRFCQRSAWCCRRGPRSTVSRAMKNICGKYHRSRDRIVQASGANLEVNFRYTHMGVTTQYRVVRAWAEEGKKLSESLKILQDDNGSGPVR